MSDDVKTTAPCPTEEELSAWYDSQETDAALEEHLATCPECKRIVGSYETIDLGVRHTLDAATDKDLSERIKERGAKRLKEDDQRRRKIGTWVRVAACIAAVIGAVLMLAYLHNRSKTKINNPNGGHARPNENGAPGIPTVAVDLSAAQLIGAAHTVEDVKKLAGQAVDDKKVHQVWSVQETAMPVKVMKELMDKKHGAHFDQLTAAEAKSCSLLLDLNHKELQGLIDHLGKCGFKLLTERGPHPGDTVPTGADADARVHYLVDFIQQ